MQFQILFSLEEQQKRVVLMQSPSSCSCLSPSFHFSLSVMRSCMQQDCRSQSRLLERRCSSCCQLRSSCNCS